MSLKGSFVDAVYFSTSVCCRMYCKPILSWEGGRKMSVITMRQKKTDVIMKLTMSRNFKFAWKTNNNLAESNLISYK